MIVHLWKVSAYEDDELDSDVFTAKAYQCYPTTKSNRKFVDDLKVLSKRELGLVAFCAATAMYEGQESSGISDQDLTHLLYTIGAVSMGIHPDFEGSQDNNFIYAADMSQGPDYAAGLDIFNRLTGGKLEAIHALPMKKGRPDDYRLVDFRTGKEFPDPWGGKRRREPEAA